MNTHQIRELRRAIDDMSTLVDDYDDMACKVVKAEAKVEDLTDELNDSERALSESHDRIEELELEVRDLKDKIVDLEAELAAAMGGGGD